MTTTVRVHYDTGFGNSIAIRGDGPGLSWDADAAATWTPGNVWEWTTTAFTDSVEWKPVFVDDGGAVTWPSGPNWIVAAGATVDVYPFFFATAGTVTTVSVDFEGTDRAVEVWLPPSYGEAGASERTYPIAFFHDGQNVFDDGAFFGGWMLDDALDALTVDGVALSEGSGYPAASPVELIVVAPHNTPDRIYEYTPVNGSYGGCDATVETCGGGADEYLAWLVDVVRPEIAAQFRVDDGPAGVLGSSLGGLVSLHACWQRPDDFTRCGVFSPSLWWSDAWILDVIDDDAGPKRAISLAVDVGTDNDGEANVDILDDILLTKPAEQVYTVGVDYQCLKGEGHAHNELAWRARSPFALSFLYRDAARVAPTVTYPSTIAPCD